MWETAVDWDFVGHLQRRLNRSGLLDRRYADQLIARHLSMGLSLNLAEKLNRRWQPLDEGQTFPVPLVYATPASMSSTHTIEKSLDGDQAANTVIQRQLVVEKNSVQQANLGNQQPELNVQTPIPDADQGVSSLPKHVKISPKTGGNAVMGTAVPITNPSATSTLHLAAAQPSSAAQPTTVQVKNQTMPVGERTAVLPFPVVQPVQLPPAAQTGRLFPASLAISTIRSAPSVADPNQTTAPPSLPLVTPEPVMNTPVTISGRRQMDMPLVGTQGGLNETAAAGSNAAPIPNGLTNPPGWMQRQKQHQDTPPTTVSLNIENLVDKVEKQLFHRLTIQRERRGKI